MSLSLEELSYLEKRLGRKPNNIELSMISAQWSEHCSYKSSKSYIKKIPSKGKHVIDSNYDTKLLDIGNGYILTSHIESHNHPSSIEPYGGAATGVGGVVRDILCSGAKPIALLNALRFGKLEDPHTKWLFKNVVKGIADYGNCIGIPTVGGEIEFDPSFEGYCLVDVACIGIAKREELVINKVEEGDYIVLAGNSTGRDGIHGAVFASKALIEEDRAAVQIPDPFMEKLLIDATLEGVKERCIKAIKDLGGGGLACALSETADKFGVGMDIELDKIHLRENMLPEEIIVSESQERMLYIVNKDSLERFMNVLNKYNIPYSIIGRIIKGKDLIIRYKDKVLTQIDSSLVANAPLIERKVMIPKINKDIIKPLEPSKVELKKITLMMLANPTIASKEWVYEQYDHEVGLRTVIKPGMRDSTLLRLYDNVFLAVKLDGNSKHCYLDPYNGTQGVFAEACRNVVALGAEPIGMVDHLQFGNPENPETYHSFVEAVNGLIDYSNILEIPCVGGKVSFYNESKKGEIKPSPVIGVIGLTDKVPNSFIRGGEKILVTGITKDELGGSEYYEYIHNIIGGSVPKPDPYLDRRLFPSIIKIVREDLASYVHDCSKGGIAIAIAEICIFNNIGALVDLDLLLRECDRLDDLLFSESHSRFVLAVDEDNIDKVKDIFNKSEIPYSIIGSFEGEHIVFNDIKIGLSEARYAYNDLTRKMDHG